MGDRPGYLAPKGHDGSKRTMPQSCCVPDKKPMLWPARLGTGGKSGALWHRVPTFSLNQVVDTRDWTPHPQCRREETPHREAPLNLSMFASPCAGTEEHSLTLRFHSGHCGTKRRPPANREGLEVSRKRRFQRPLLVANPTPTPRHFSLSWPWLSMMLVGGCRVLQRCLCAGFPKQLQQRDGTTNIAPKALSQSAEALVRQKVPCQGTGRHEDVARSSRARAIRRVSGNAPHASTNNLSSRSCTSRTP